VEGDPRSRKWVLWASFFHPWTGRYSIGNFDGTSFTREDEIRRADWGRNSFAARTWREAPEGRTSPDELIAAAHASCFSMALSNALAKSDTPATSLDTSVEVDFQPGVGITEIRITVSGDVPGLDAALFAEAAENAKLNCPVSKALAAVPIQLTVR
jgi:osmotically inducible protein OsmC